jgi:hypothetical protein
MPITSPVAIVDAIMTDLVANSGLSPANQRSYAEPTIIFPGDCPLLAVWCETTTYELLTSGLPNYERVHDVKVAWYVANAAEAETGGTGDPAVVAALDITIETLIARIQTYTDGVPSIGSQLITTILSRALAPQEGSIWRGLIELRVEEAA